MAGGEFDGVVEAVGNMWSAGELQHGKIMTDSDSEFFGHERCTWGDDSCTENVARMVGEDFDKTVIDTVDFTSGDVFEIDNGFAATAFHFGEVDFIIANDGNFWKSINGADEASVAGVTFGTASKIRNENRGLIFGALGGRFATNTVANGVNIASGSLEHAIDFDTGFGVFDAGVL